MGSLYLAQGMISRLPTPDHRSKSDNVRISSEYLSRPTHQPQVDFGSGVHLFGIRRQEFPREKILKPIAFKSIRRVG